VLAGPVGARHAPPGPCCCPARPSTGQPRWEYTGAPETGPSPGALLTARQLARNIGLVIRTSMGRLGGCGGYPSARHRIQAAPCWSSASASSASTICGRLTTIARSSPKPAASLQSSAAGEACRAAGGPAGGAGDARSPSGAATARAARRPAQGTANPVAVRR
jgi:hypothetical protein